MTVSARVSPDLSAGPSGTRFEDVVGQIAAAAGPLPQIEIDFEPDICTLWVTLKPEPKPVFTLQIIESVRKLQATVLRLWPEGRDCPVLFLAYRGTGAIFSLGGDLDFYLDCLASNDRASLVEYAALAADVIRWNATGLDGLVLSLSTIRGKALGGGIDPARACNIMIAEESATFGYPEVNYNHFPISAVPILSRHTGVVEAQRILLSGADYSAADFLKLGLLDAVVPAGTGEGWIRKYAAQAAPSHRARVALLAVFNRRAGDLRQELAAGAEAWVEHMFKLTPLEISKLQRIAHAQERLLARFALHSAPSQLAAQ
jgi:DSF synthase